MAKKSALIIIDVQQGLFADEPRPYEADEVIARINALAADARSKGVPVVFVQHEVAKGVLAYGSEGWQLEGQLLFEEGDVVVRKTTPDSFLNTHLGDLLSEWGSGHLVICGYACEFCVDTTVRRSAALGFDVTLVSDAHTTHDKAHASGRQIREHHNATLPDISSFEGDIEAKSSLAIKFGS